MSIQTGGTSIRTLCPLYSGVTSSKSDLHRLDRQSYTTIKGRQGNILAIVYEYRHCKIPLAEVDPLTNTM